jgi:hypothetical protein
MHETCTGRYTVVQEKPVPAGTRLVGSAALVGVCVSPHSSQSIDAEIERHLSPSQPRPRWIGVRELGPVTVAVRYSTIVKISR